MKTARPSNRQKVIIENPQLLEDDKKPTVKLFVNSGYGKFSKAYNKNQRFTQSPALVERMKTVTLSSETAKMTNSDMKIKIPVIIKNLIYY